MLFFGHHLQIINVIVHGIVVFVMNDTTLGNRAMVSFPDNTMQLLGFSIYSLLFIFDIIFCRHHSTSS